MLEVKNVYKKFKDKQVLKGVSFNIKKANNVALLGNNGAGKSTLIKIISGEITTDSGSIKTNLKFDSEMGIMPQDDILIDDLRVEEIVALKLSMCNLKTDNCQQLLQKVELENFSRSYISTLSGGQKRRLSLLLSILNNPEIVFLDEPTTGMDLNAVDNFWDLMKKSAFTSVIITHDFNQIDNFFDQVCILNEGVIAANIAISEIHDSGQTVEEYYRQVVRGG
ncbi:ABC transporter ATP-binding protein [Lactobacillus sp. DCY120]|uniref:ABC transporter ATP-binding protein n=1 Tax=Bombilactobacillus apium TaxID=2675299 RepID=A0A850R9Q6_9LACO|nr:ABC transporter ATP-binding protein [Bombilactobacillus apium]NVY96126.1 ABC transporter ATP-binding protein [Bombilactobacillus apium]